jgi:hypothetical protein
VCSLSQVDLCITVRCKINGVNQECQTQSIKLAKYIELFTWAADKNLAKNNKNVYYYVSVLPNPWAAKVFNVALYTFFFKIKQSILKKKK